MTNTALAIGIFQAQTTAEFAVAVEAGQATETDFTLLEGGLRAASIADADFYRALRAGNRSQIARLLSDRKRRTYLWQAKLRLSHLNLFAPREILIEAAASALLPLVKSTPSSPGLQSQAAPPGEGSQCHSDYGYFYQASGHGTAQRKRANSGPVYPTFSLQDFADRSAEEMVAAALAFHRKAAIMRPPGMSAFSRRSQEEIARIQRPHRVMVTLLEQPEERLTLSDKEDLLALLHGEDERIQNHLNHFLRQLSLPLGPDEMASVRSKVAKIIHYGLPDLIDLHLELESQGDSHQEEAQSLLRRLAAGEVKIFMGPASALLKQPGVRLEPLSLEIPRSVTDLPSEAQRGANNLLRTAGITWDDLAIVMAYTTQLVGLTDRINRMRAHAHDLGDFTARLRQALTHLSYPQMVPIDPKWIPNWADAALRTRLLEFYPHGMVAIEQRDVEKIYNDSLALGQTTNTSDDYFPVLLVAPPEGLENGSIEIYTLPRFQERLSQLLREVGLEARVTLHPFLPLPNEALLLKATLAQFHLEEMALVQVLTQMEGKEDSRKTDFPEPSVMQTRLAHRHPLRAIRQGVLFLERQLREERSVASESDQGLVQRFQGALRFLQDTTLSLEVRAAFCNVFSEHVGAQIFSFVDTILERYALAKTREEKEVIAREFLAGYFLHFPWGWGIMVEEGVKREQPLGLKSAAPLGVAEVLAEDRPLACRFAYGATHLAGLSETQAALILRTVAQLPWGDDVSRRHRRFEHLAALALPTDEQAYAYLKNYAVRADPGGTRLGIFLNRLAERQNVIDPSLRFRTALANAWRVYIPTIQEAETQFRQATLALANDDPLHTWDLSDALSFFTYHLGGGFEEKEAIQILKNLALVAKGWKHLREGGERSDDDPLIKAVKALAEPAPFADTLRGLGVALNSGELRSPLFDFLKRQSGNLHALQYLLVAFYLQRHLGQPQSRLVQLLRAEHQLAELENAHGKIRHDQFLKYALFDTFHFHLAPVRFAIEAELKMAREFADREDVVAVEVIPETWLESVVDFRIHLKDGSSFLVEVKTLRYNGNNREAFVAKLRDQIGKAGWQLWAQRRSSGDSSLKDQIILLIHVPRGKHLTEEEIQPLYSMARQLVADRHYFFVETIRIEQRED